MTYRVKNWNLLYENNRTRGLKRMDWVPVPNRQDGDGYTDLVDRENGAALFGCWIALLQVASRCEPRGTLLREGARPHDSASLSRMTRLPKELVEKTLKICVTECKWLEIITPHEGAGIPQEDAPLETHDTDYGTEGNGTEGNERERNKSHPTLAQVLEKAKFVGCPPDEAEKFFHHFEAPGWIDKHGNAITNWESKLATWAANFRSKPLETAHKAKPEHAQGMSGIDKVLKAKELERVQARMQLIRGNYAGHQTWSDDDRAEIKDLKFKRSTLRKELGLEG